MSAESPVPPRPSVPRASSPSKPLMHSLGEFFGHVWKGITDDPHSRVVHRETQHEQRDTPQGKVVLRRTIIEEVVLKEGVQRASDRASTP